MSIESEDTGVSLDVEELLSEAKGQVCVYDLREKSAYIDSLRMRLPDFTFVSQTLPVGDYIVNGIIIERKTLEDLIQSIYDVRLNNQLFEMSKNTHLSVLAIIGDQGMVRMDPLKNSIVQSVKAGVWFERSPVGAQGMVIPLEFFDDDEFAFFLKGLSKKDGVRLPKLTKTRVTGNDQLVMTLATIPSWGEKLARAALEVYGTLEGMIQVSPKDMEDEVKGCGKKKAQAFHEHFRMRYESRKLGSGRSRKTVLSKHGQRRLNE
jgi:DNA excision repair protein ERCC-4